MKFFETVKYIIYTLLFITLISSLRNLFFPLIADELQYAEIAVNCMTKGAYSLSGVPSTFTPTLPFLIALFYSKSFPIVGFAAVKFFNLILMIVGLRFVHLTLKKVNIPANISLIIVLLTAVNTIFVSWSTAVYPEAILFCFFWIFIFYVLDEIKSPRQILFFLIPFSILAITRYLYGVCIFIVGYFIWNYLIKLIQSKDYQNIYKLVLYSVVCVLPLIIWFKYVYLVEKEITIEQSYFTRFKENDIFYNIKAGLGIIQHAEVNKINGIPAFVSLFLPVTGLRNWIISIGLIAAFCFGYISKWKIKEYRLIFITIILIMLGLIVAGTGFSRYWLVLLPGYWLGFYFCFSYLKIEDNYFEKISLLLAVIYVINELRLDYLIVSKL
jgi:hypothetical protein